MYNRVLKAVDDVTKNRNHTVLLCLSQTKQCIVV